MAIIFFQQRKRQRYLIGAFIVMVLAILVIVWQGFLLKPKTQIEILKPPEIKINFEVLKNPILESFQSLEEISPFEEETGRENPFLPY